MEGMVCDMEQVMDMEEDKGIDSFVFRVCLRFAFPCFSVLEHVYLCGFVLFFIFNLIKNKY
jgi:hypothetical protein